MGAVNLFLVEKDFTPRLGDSHRAGHGRYDEGFRGQNRNGRTGHARAKRGQVVVAGGICAVGEVMAVSSLSKISQMEQVL